MRRISGTFASKNAANDALDALKEAGVSTEAIALDASGPGDAHVVTANVDENVADAARAIFGQAGARDVSELGDSEATVEGESVERFRNPVPPIASVSR